MVLDSHGDPVSIVSSNELKYSGGLYNVITNADAARAADHVIVTNDVQSGDWLLQSANDIIETEIKLRTAQIPSVLLVD